MISIWWYTQIPGDLGRLLPSNSAKLNAMEHKYFEDHQQNTRKATALYLYHPWIYPTNFTPRQASVCWRNHRNHYRCDMISTRNLCDEERNRGGKRYLYNASLRYRINMSGATHAGEVCGKKRVRFLRKGGKSTSTWNTTSMARCIPCLKLYAYQEL